MTQQSQNESIQRSLMETERVVEASSVTPPAWSEHTSVQVKKMEMAIEQDLSKAMAGLRHQFRQQFDADRDVGGSSEMSASATIQEVGSAASSNFGDSVASRFPASANNLDLTERSVGLRETSANQPVTEFKNEAVAARDDMLHGLARLRRELEAQRSSQNQTAANAAAVERERQQFQVVASEVAINDLRRDFLAHQAVVTDLRRDLTSQQESYQRRVNALEVTVSRLTSAVEALQDGEASLRNGMDSMRGDLQDAQDFCGRISEIKNKQGTPAPSVPVLRVEELSRAIDQERSFRETEQTHLRNHLDKALAKLQGDLERGMRVELEVLFGELKARIDSVEGELRVANVKAIASSAAGSTDGANSVDGVEDVSRRISVVEAEARKNSLALGQIGEVLRLTQTLHAGSDKVAEHLAQESASRKVAEDQFKAMLGQLENRVMNVESGFGSDSAKVAAVEAVAMKPSIAPLGTSLKLEEASSEAQRRQVPLITGDLKQSLERLVDKVSKTLSEPAVERRLAADRPFAATTRQTQVNESVVASGKLNGTVVNHLQREAPSVPLMQNRRVFGTATQFEGNGSVLTEGASFGCATPACFSTMSQGAVQGTLPTSYGVVPLSGTNPSVTRQAMTRTISPERGNVVVPAAAPSRGRSISPSRRTYVTPPVYLP
eukprot:TRINITY_DN42299_c0_g1_i1.p1 TRINITY_DN42299_c0_g1~~TRINITY_DN42299_c0_g1_i1.p1  ORF type:complete len:665 (+),score=132.04 TRINITY_DN42299_c0_g1_i1:123-2117(+)